ncbi:MAG: PilZ domain-containing protein [Spirochaetes bacterium]|nr:PilZ domain-containing protein [Spirochaetota bacterium]
MTSEKRRSPRFIIHQIVKLEYGRQEIIYAQGKNISITGILCYSTSCIELQSRAYIMFSIPDHNELVQCEGVVVRCTAHGEGYVIGIEFSELSEKDHKLIAGIADRHS